MALTDNLVSYWKLDESSGNPADSSGNSVTLTNNNTVGFGSAKINNGADFGSSNSSKYLEVANNLSIDGGAMTMNFWVNVTTNPTSGDVAHFVMQGNNSSKTINFIRYFNDSGTFKIQFARGKNNVGDQLVQHTYTLTTGTWFMLTYTYDGSTITAYINGTSVGTASASGNGSGTFSFVNGVRLGRHTLPAGASYFSGLLDEVGIWSRALTGAEITSLYNSGNGLTYPFVTGVDFSISETLALSETSTNLRARLFTTTETLSLSETWANLKGIGFTIADSLGLVEAYAYTKTHIISIAESLGLIESSSARMGSEKWTEKTRSSSTWAEKPRSSSTWTEKDRS